MAWTAYECCFAVLVLLYVSGIAFKRRRSSGSLDSCSSVSPAFLRFQRTFLLIFFIAMAADWMQGPYVYRLYSFYGFSRHENGMLFIAGFGSSLLFGTWVGPLADLCGRKTVCVLYCVSYILSCATKHVNDFNVLIVGRILGGVATSILWSAFESWMISEHNKHGFDVEWMGHTFSLMTMGNGLVAVASGLVAQWSVDIVEHPVAPFDLSATLLFLCMIAILSLWTNNYGSTQTDMWRQMREATWTIIGDRRILLTGIQQSLFEGAMYAFIFLWTPILDVNGDVPHGLVFASFMIAVSLGGTVFNMSVPQVVELMPFLYTLAAATMLTVAFCNMLLPKLLALLTFEFLVGLFWPSIATLRAAYIPDECRTTVMNIFRAPLNAIVCLLLFFQGDMALPTVFGLCAMMHLAAMLSAILLRRATARSTAV